ncbi:MAG: pilus assembly PilX N-terminal domain-containing protein [Pseudomonadota bacterium]
MKFTKCWIICRKQGPKTTEIADSWLYLPLRPVKNDDGAILVIAIMLLAVLTILGVAALNTTTTEIRISGNEKVYKQAFYNAEAGISYAIERGVTFFPPDNTPGFITLSPTPADLAAASPGTIIEYDDKAGSPRRVEVRATGNVAGGGVSTIIAGLVGVLGGNQGGSGIGETSQYGSSSN